MRFQEFIIESKKRVDRDGITIEYEFHKAYPTSKDKMLWIKALDAGGREMGAVNFRNIGNEWEGDDLYVDDRFRGQGIATIMYDFAKETLGHIVPSLAQTDDGKSFWQGKAVWESELDEIARIPQGEFGTAGTIVPPGPEVERKELPGGSGLTYGINKENDLLEIMIFDDNSLAGELDLVYTRGATKTWGVDTIAVDPAHRGQGIAKALYGIALSILKLPLEAGQMQTKHGQAMWLMLNSIPGVEVMGYDQVPTERYQAQPGDQIVFQNKRNTGFTFPVRPGTHSMRSGRKGTGIYTSPSTTMIAQWTGS